MTPTAKGLKRHLIAQFLRCTLSRLFPASRVEPYTEAGLCDDLWQLLSHRRRQVVWVAIVLCQAVMHYIGVGLLEGIGKAKVVFGSYMQQTGDIQVYYIEV